MPQASSYLTVDLTACAPGDAEAAARGAARIVDILANALGDRRGTFFVSSRIARTTPSLVRDLSLSGHEIACRGGGRQTEGALAHAVALLEQVSNQRVVGHRAKTLAGRTVSVSMLEMLAQNGFAYDSSLIDARPRAALTPFDAYPFGNATLYEFPLRQTSIPGGISVGLISASTFRLLPVAMLLRLMRRSVEGGYVPVIQLDAGTFERGLEPGILGAMLGFGSATEKLIRILEAFPNCGPMAESVPGLESVATLRRATMRLIA